MSDKIERKENHKIFVTGENGGMIQTQSVEAHILLAILEKLDEINTHLIDIDSNTYER